MLQAALVIDEPLLHGGIPLVAEALARCLHRRLSLDGGLLIPKSVALQLQPPLPARTFWLGDEAAPVEMGGPLLAGIARLPVAVLALHGQEGMTPGIIRGADALPVGLVQALGGLIQ